MHRISTQPLDVASVQVARTVAAQLPAGELMIVGVPTPLPAPIAELLRSTIKHVAAGVTVALVVGDVLNSDDVGFSDAMIRQLTKDGKIIPG